MWAWIGKFWLLYLICCFIPQEMKRRFLDQMNTRQTALRQQFKLVAAFTALSCIVIFPTKNLWHSATIDLADLYNTAPRLFRLHLATKLGIPTVLTGAKQNIVPEWPLSFSSLTNVPPKTFTLCALIGAAQCLSPSKSFHTHVQTRPSHTTFRFYTAKTPHHQIGPRLSILR